MLTKTQKPIAEEFKINFLPTKCEIIKTEN